MDTDKFIQPEMEAAIVFFRGGGADTYAYHCTPIQGELVPQSLLSKKNLRDLCDAQDSKVDIFGNPEWIPADVIYKDSESVIWIEDGDDYEYYHINVAGECTTRVWPERMVLRFNAASNALYIGQFTSTGPNLSAYYRDLSSCEVAPVSLGSNADGFRVHSCGMGLDKFGTDNHKEVMSCFMDSALSKLPDYVGDTAGPWYHRDTADPITLDDFFKQTWR